MHGAMPQAMPGGCSEQSTQRNATDATNERVQDSPKSSSVSERVRVADEQFTFYIEALQAMRRDSYRIRRMRGECTDMRRGTDRELARLRAYDEDTERLRVLARRAREKEMA